MTMSLMMMELAKHPEIVEKMYHEVVSVCGESGDIDWDMVHNLKSVSCFIARSSDDTSQLC